MYADFKDSFGQIELHPETALSASIFFYKNKGDGLPTLNSENAVKDKNNEPILYPAFILHHHTVKKIYQRSLNILLVRPPNFIKNIIMMKTRFQM